MIVPPLKNSLLLVGKEVSIMAFMITEECIACGACEAECPNEAISDGDPVYVIDPNVCTECVGFYDKPQCVDVCPVEAIVPNPDYQETREQLLEKKTRIHGSVEQ